MRGCKGREILIGDRKPDGPLSVPYTGMAWQGRYLIFEGRVGLMEPCSCFCSQLCLYTKIIFIRKLLGNCRQRL